MFYITYISGQTINLKLYSCKNPVQFAKPPADVFNGRFGQQKKRSFTFLFSTGKHSD